MALKARIDQDFIDAYKNKDSEKVSVLRMIKSAIKNLEINEKHDADDSEVLKILKKESKQRLDSISEFKRANRNDLVEKEARELEIIKPYLPEQLSEEKVAAIIIDTIKELEAASVKDIGKVMASVMAKIGSQADGATISRIVREKLQN